MLVRKGIKCGGNDKGVRDFVEFNAGRPRDGLSAKFEADGTYNGEIHKE